MVKIIIANICSFGAIIADTVCGTRKTRKGILIAQDVSQIFYMSSSLLLNAYSACVQNSVTLLRNILIGFGIENKFTKYFFVLLPVILGIVFNNRGLLGYLPIIANFIMSLGVYVFKDEPIKIKYSFAISTAIFVIFNFYILNFVGAIGSMVISISTIISAVKMKKELNLNK